MEHKLKVFTEYLFLMYRFAKHCTTKALHYPSTAAFFPDSISVQVQSNKTDLMALSKRYFVFIECQLKFLKSGQKIC